MKNLSLLFLIILLLTNCNQKPKKGEIEKNIKEEVLNAYNDMYNTYSNGTDEFFNYFENEFVRVSSEGNIEVGVEQPIKEWNEFLKSYSMELISFDSPKMVVGSGQVVTINTFEELFITKDIKDTTYNKGVYVAVWRKQTDNTWKISMDTWHAGLE